jgi:hypothetical protein
MALSTAADYINNRILRHAAQLRPGYTASPELQQDVLSEWQALVDEWNTDRSMPVSVPDYTYAITGSGFAGNYRDYKIGPTAPAGNFIGPRPEKILLANLLLMNVPTQPVRIPLRQLSYEEYYSIPALQFSPTNVTEAYYYEATFPNGVLHFWPPINGNSIELFTFGVLTAPAALDTVVAGTFPPGYENAVVYSLAHRCQFLCTKEMGKRNPVIGSWALRARQKVKNINAPNPTCLSDFQNNRNGVGAYDPNVTYVGEPY